MVREPSSSEAEPPTGAAAHLRQAIDAGHEALLRSVAVLVSRSQPGRRWPEVLDLAAEVLHEAVREALTRASRFDPRRSATAWVRGIAARLLLSRRRADARARRCVTATVLGEEAWEAALQGLCVGPADPAV